MTNLRLAARQLLRQPAFTLVAVVTLALGIGANTAIFSVVNAVLLRPPPFPGADRLVAMHEKSRTMDDMSVSYPNYRDWRAQQSTLTDLGAFRSVPLNLSGGLRDPEPVTALQFSASMFKVLGVKPLLGRTFSEIDDSPAGEPVVLLSEGLWRRRYGADRAILGKSITLDSRPTTVIGIMPVAFQFPRRVELWLPLGQPSEWLDVRGWHPGMYAAGRLKPGVTLEAARADLETIARRLESEYPDSNTGSGIVLEDLQRYITGPQVRAALWLILGAVGFVLLIACANVANLLLARAASRRKEIAIRRALGARRWPVVRQLLTESVLLSLLGGLAGLGLAALGIRLLTLLIPAQVRDFVTLSIDASVLAYTFAIAVGTGILFGLAPAAHLLGVDSADVLKDGTRETGGSDGRGWIRRGLVVAEISVALVLLIGGSLLLRSLHHLHRATTGFEPAGVLTAELSLPERKYRTNASQVAFCDAVLRNLKEIPGVNSAAVVSPLPLDFGGWQSNVRVEGEPVRPPGDELLSEMFVASPEYFQTAGVRLVRGRAFHAADDGRARVCIVDQTFERKHLGGDGLGRRLAMGRDGTNWMTIVGITAHVKNRGAAESSRIQTYLPFAQEPATDFAVMVRASVDPRGLEAALRSAVRRVDADQPVAQVRTLAELVVQTESVRRLASTLIGIFAAIAAVLAAVGIYGVMAFNVSRRTREIGIRIALGAATGDVLRMVLHQGAVLVGIGVALGLAGAFSLAHFLEATLFGIRSTDPWTYVTAPLILAVVAGLACLLPARRASRVDPLSALRTH